MGENWLEITITTKMQSHAKVKNEIMILLLVFMVVGLNGLN